MQTERIRIRRDKTTGEARYTGVDRIGDEVELSGFAGDIAHEVAYSLMEDTQVELADITVTWAGVY